MRHKAEIWFLVIFLSFSSCAAAAKQQSDSDFYEGLQKRQEGARSEAITRFEKALNADNPSIAAAAAAELMSMRFAGVELSAATMAGIRQKAALPKTGRSQAGSSWAAALDAVEPFNKEQFLALMLIGESRSLDEAALYALEKWRSGRAAEGRQPPESTALTDAESAVINGRIAASRSRYSEALLFFRIALHDSPDLFFRYPDLLTDLGRAFQYTSTGTEGIDFFLKWEKTFDDEKFSLNREKTFGDEKFSLNREKTFDSDNGIMTADSENLIRFRLLFFAARIARQRGRDSIELYEQALPYALEVSPEQADACIWYILDSSLAGSPDVTIRYLEKYAPHWHDAAYFSDVLDKLARELVRQRQWADIATVCAILQSRLNGNRPDKGGAAAAQYAWITGKAIEEGLYSPGKNAAEYKRMAYDAAAMPGGGAWYYRSLSAAALGAPFLVLPEDGAAAAETAPEKPTPLMEFLLGFFENGAARFAPRYIRQAENDLSNGELRRLAEALGAAGQYQESMRLVSLYTRRGGYRIARQDLELLHPRPFRELVERYAEETGIEPSLLYGLIRTESAFNHTVVSRAGAIGLTQLMPATALETAARLRRQGGPDYARAGTDENADEDSPLDLLDPAVNIHIGAVYLAYLGERMEDPLLALLAYNGGMTRVRRWRRAADSAFGRQPGGSFPLDLFLETVEYPETRNYGKNVMGAAAVYKELYYR